MYNKDKSQLYELAFIVLKSVLLGMDNRFQTDSDTLPTAEQCEYRSTSSTHISTPLFSKILYTLCKKENNILKRLQSSLRK